MAKKKKGDLFKVHLDISGLCDEGMKRLEKVKKSYEKHHQKDEKGRLIVSWNESTNLSNTFIGIGEDLIDLQGKQEDPYIAHLSDDELDQLFK